jgi:peptide/nickel transport system substrate-binding protein/microcin C transport system substrate-binding protein
MTSWTWPARTRRAWGLLLLACGAAVAAPAGDTPPSAFTGRWVGAYAAYGAPKYAPGFTHFEYVNADAPKGGTLRLRNPDRRSSFDKYNYWTVRGNAPAGVLIWMVEGLAHLAQDEPQTMYGLLAESMNVAPDFSSIAFRIDPRARFHNGDPVLAKDVVHSFAMLSGKQAAPSVQTQLAGIARVVVVDARTVRFELRERTRDQLFVAGTMPVFSHKWGDGKPFDQVITEVPITSGPYRIHQADMPRRIEFALDPNYWAKDHPVRRGHFNFERVVYRMYADQAVAREAFKAGEFDLFKEYGGRSWVRLHKGPKWDDGRIVKKAWQTATGQGLQAYNLNLRRAKFQDIRVREALGLTYDFDTGAQRTGLYKRAHSVFSNSPFAAEGLPGPGELALLEPFRSELPAEVFGPAYRAPGTGGDPSRLRANLLRARALLAEAGWTLAEDGKLRNAAGEAFTIEYLSPREGGYLDWQRNLEKLGIELTQRVVDFALYRRRLETYDYDMIVIVEGDFTLPKASDMAALYSSKSADEEGNNNFRGVKSRVADRLIEAMAGAQTMQSLQDAARAFDRVVMWNHWQVPDLYSDSENFSYWNRFGIPSTAAKYFTADTLISGFIEFGPWPLWTWWDKSLEGKR